MYVDNRVLVRWKCSVAWDHRISNREKGDASSNLVFGFSLFFVLEAPLVDINVYPIGGVHIFPSMQVYVCVV